MKKDLESNINRIGATGTHGKGSGQFTTEGSLPQADHRVLYASGAVGLATIIGIGGYLYLLDQANGNGNEPVVPPPSGIDQPTNSPMPSQEPTIPINTPQGTFEVTFPPTNPPVETASPSPEAPTLEQNLENWISGETEIDLSQNRWRLGGDGRYLNLGLIKEIDNSMNDSYYYTGILLGSTIDSNGHIIVFVGMEDETEQKNRYFVPFRLGDKLKWHETSSQFIAEIDSPRERTLSTAIRDRILDGSYLNKAIEFTQPFDKGYYQLGLYPINFPNLAQEIDANKQASEALHRTAISARTNDINTIKRPKFINMAPDEASSYTGSLPYFFQGGVLII